MHTLCINNTASLLSGGRVTVMLQYEMNPFIFPAAIIRAKSVANSHLYTDLFAGTDGKGYLRLDDRLK